MNKDDIDTIENAVNVALARQRAAFDRRVTVLETGAEIFAASLGLLQIVADPTGCAARVKELQGALDKVAAAQAGLAAERQALDTATAAMKAELAALDAAVRKREVAVRIRERELDEAKVIWAPPPDPNFIAGSTLSREPYTEPPLEDAHYPLAAIEPLPPRNKAVRVSR
jgi:hypothetical protein